MSYHLTPGEPKIDGILYDDMWGLSREQRIAMAARGVAWETEFNMDGVDFVGCVIAATREEAEQIADARGLGEKVLRKWVEAEIAQD